REFRCAGDGAQLCCRCAGRTLPPARTRNSRALDRRPSSVPRRRAVVPELTSYGLAFVAHDCRYSGCVRLRLLDLDAVVRPALHYANTNRSVARTFYSAGFDSETTLRHGPGSLRQPQQPLPSGLSELRNHLRRTRPTRSRRTGRGTADEG